MSLKKTPNFLQNIFGSEMTSETQHSYRFKSFRLDVEDRQLLNDGIPVPLTPKVFDVLVLLVERAGYLVKKDDLMETVWPDAFVEDANLSRAIHTLRRALGEDQNGNKFIATVAKQGYRFVAEVKSEAAAVAKLSISGTNGKEAYGWPEDLRAELAQEIGSQSRSENPLSLDFGELRLDGAEPDFAGDIANSELLDSSADKRLRLGWIGLIAILLSCFAGFTWWQFSSPDTNPPLQRSASQFFNWNRDLNENPDVSARFSPDGKLVAFASTKSGVSAIWLKQVNGGEGFTQKQDKWGDRSPVFSPDGQQIAFISERDGKTGIWTMPTLGGVSVLLKNLDGADQTLLKWSKDGSAIYFDHGKNLFALDLASKQIAKLTELDSWETPQISFAVSPDEEHFAFVGSENARSDIWVIARNGGPASRVTNDEFEEEFLVWHPDGKRIIYDSVRSGISQLFEVSRSGGQPGQLIFSDNSNYISDISPDGKKILYLSQRDESDLWRVDVANSKESRLTDGIGVEMWADPAPDNEKFAFQTERTRDATRRIVNASILVQKVGGAGRSVQLTEDGFLPLFSPDGVEVAFLRSANDGTSLWSIPSIGGEAKALTRNGVSFNGYALLPFNRVQTQDYEWSPDARSLVYCARRDNVSNVWQTAADGSGEKLLTNNARVGYSFTNPVTSPDGARIALLGLSYPSAEQKGRRWTVWVYEAGETKVLFQAATMLGIVGWSARGDEIIIKSSPVSKASPFPQISSF